MYHPHVIKLRKSLTKNLPPTKTFFFTRKSFFFFLTYIQPPMAHLKITFWNFIFDRVAQLLASKGSKKHLLGHISSFECCNFAKKNIGVSLAYIEFLLLLVHSGQVAGNVRFFSKMTFLTSELDTSPHKLV
jgi:hypothetical protein